MADFTYEYENRCARLETYEWDNNWLEHCEDTHTPRVLYIGDSISCGTRKAANQLTNGALLFDGIGTSKAVDNEFLIPTIRLWGAQQPHRKFVLFNNGLHGWHMDADAYADAYERIVEFLKEEFSSSKLFLLLTTHVADEARDGDVVVRNQAILKIAAKHGLPTVDLYTVTLKNKHLLSPDGVHFSHEGYDCIAQEILTTLTEKGASI